MSIIEGRIKSLCKSDVLQRRARINTYLDHEDTAVIVMGLILARGGSKGLPRKNILPLVGKPLIAYTIEVARASAILDRVIVSTDDQEIAEVAKRYGADVPFHRPTDLAKDDTSVFPALLHAVTWLSEHEGYNPGYVMLLQPTSPFRTVEDIQGAVSLAVRKQGDAVVSVSPVRQHPYWMKQISEDGRLISQYPPEHAAFRRQELPTLYVPNGAIYLVVRSVLLEKQTFYTERTYGYVIPAERSLDIDNAWDLYLAELIMKDRMNREKK